MSLLRKNDPGREISSQTRLKCQSNRHGADFTVQSLREGKREVRSKKGPDGGRLCRPRKDWLLLPNGVENHCKGPSRRMTPSHSSFRKITLAVVFSGYYSNLMGLQVASDG